mmetsp:Transcript_7622/g.26626  ORF Transcript_7622/g.26626 Transcript_7622/m.26626 type:complete len:305 (+) Transcript_7622:202-1116(+)
MAPKSTSSSSSASGGNSAAARPLKSASVCANWPRTGLRRTRRVAGLSRNAAQRSAVAASAASTSRRARRSVSPSAAGCANFMALTRASSARDASRRSAWPGHAAAASRRAADSVAAAAADASTTKTTQAAFKAASSSRRASTVDSSTVGMPPRARPRTASLVRAGCAKKRPSRPRTPPRCAVACAASASASLANAPRAPVQSSRRLVTPAEYVAKGLSRSRRTRRCLIAKRCASCFSPRLSRSTAAPRWMAARQARRACWRKSSKTAPSTAPCSLTSVSIVAVSGAYQTPPARDAASRSASVGV